MAIVMKKIGIITFHFAHNYGAVLQAYALQEYLKSLGHSVTIINYRQKNLARYYALFDIRRILSGNILRIIKRTIVETLLFTRRCVRYIQFEQFIKGNLKLSKRVNKDDIPGDFDLYILGSDQIWNSRITKGFDTIYFGDFPVKKGARKISYAASMEAISLTQEEAIFFESHLRKIDMISVRESTLKNILQPLTNKHIHTTLDPTLLLDASYWDKLIKRPSINRKYVLIYQVVSSIVTLDIANNVADQLGAIVLEVSSKINRYKIEKNYRQCVSPGEFIGLIKYASCVITTSFHGTIFSIISKKPFYTIKVGNWDTRVDSLLASFDLSDRGLPVEKNQLVFSEIDYTQVYFRLELIKQESILFIQNAISAED
jgi:hypothetical protein